MAVREYIGARYVLKIYENSHDPQSANWEAGVHYEPLVMVNYNNSSYISRKHVPANVGNPVENPSYWALSGLYNGQIASLQQQINRVDEVSKKQVNNRVYLFCADSFDSQRSISETGWISPLCNRLGITDYIKCSQGSHGFCGVDNSLHWVDLVAALSTADKNRITDIFIGGCAADIHNNPQLIVAQMEIFDTYVRENIPNLKTITLAYLSYTYATAISILSEQITSRQATLDKAKELGWAVIDGAEYIIADPITRMNAHDNLHPDSTGVNRISAQLSSGIQTNHVNASRFWTSTLTMSDTLYSASDLNATWYHSINNGIYRFEQITLKYVEILSGIQDTSWHTLGTLDVDEPIILEPFTIPCMIVMQDTSDWHRGFCQIRVAARKAVQIRFANFKTNELAAGNHLSIPPFSFCAPLNSYATNI